MVTLWHGSIFHLNGSLCGKIYQSPVDSPNQRFSDAGENMFSILVSLNKLLNMQPGTSDFKRCSAHVATPWQIHINTETDTVIHNDQKGHWWHLSIFATLTLWGKVSQTITTTKHKEAKIGCTIGVCHSVAINGRTLIIVKSMQLIWESLPDLHMSCVLTKWVHDC